MGDLKADDVRRSAKNRRRYTLTDEAVENASTQQPTPHPLVQMQRLVGNRAVSEMIQRKIKTRTKSFNATKRDGVTDLTAIIGADDQWVRGTKPNPGEPSRINSVGYPIKTRYVGGHMLNQEFGGLGDSDNMIVQSDTSNKGMNKHDNILKRMGATARRLEDNGNPYQYYAVEEIDVKPAKPDGTENFPGERHVPEAIEVNIYPKKIAKHAQKSKRKVSVWTTHGETINNPYIIKNVPPYPAKPGVAKPKRKTAKQLHLANRNKIKKLIQKPKHKFANKFRAKHFSLIKGIGPKKATSLENYFKSNPTMLLSLLSTQNLSGKGFNQNDVNLLLYSGLK